ncbi:MAG: formate dehydrogenase family accessory protein FdhD, partial [Labilithrix sp.]|nr:formate dehydrogenase family accessory protein FdhD [Labilithrix sp.]
MKTVVTTGSASKQARAVRSVDVVRVGLVHAERVSDEIAVEEPLEIRISGETLAITMRTPGNDRELVLGFLLAEGVITGAKDVASIVHCGRTTDEGRENTIDVTLAPGVKPPIDDETGMLARRGTLVTSACGVCGRQSIDDLLARVAPLPDGGSVSVATLAAAVKSLRERQPVFARTGGCHAASLVSFAGDHVATFEDVGRHNAVDKVVGSRVLAGALPLTDHLLVVSGRSSFEIVQKALAAGLPLV